MPTEDNLEYLINALSIEEEDSLTCGDCEERLPDYLQAEIDEKIDDRAWSEIRLHLKICPYCAGAYEELKDLLALARGEWGQEPPAYPNPDLSFLHMNQAETSPPPQTFRRADTLGRRLIEFSAELLQAWQPPAALAVGLKKQRTEKILYQLDWRDADTAIQAAITVKQHQDDPTRCAILIEIGIPDRAGWPELAGVAVILKHDDKLVQTESTTAFGQVIFEEITIEDLPGLVFEIAPLG